MKGILHTLFFYLIFQPFIVYSQNYVIPSSVDSIFKSSYARAVNTEWQTDGIHYSVAFAVSNGQRVHLVYDTLGRVVEKYMALSHNSLPPSIAEFLKENHPSVSVKNYWVKQKGMERIYKLQLLDEVSGGGKIVGANFGGEEMDSMATGLIASSQIVTDSLSTTYEVLYFDRFGNKISSQDALSEFFVAKQKTVPKPTTYYTKKSKSKFSKRRGR